MLDVRRTKGNGGGVHPTRRNPSNRCKTGFQKFAGNIKKSEICRCWLPFYFSCVRCARAFFSPERARARTHAVLVRSERRLVRFFFVLEEELRPPFCFKQQSFRAGRALRRSRCIVPPLPSVPFVSRKRPGHSRSPLVSEPGQQEHQVRPGRRFQVIHHFPHILDKRSFVLLSPPISPHQRGDFVRAWRL